MYQPHKPVYQPVTNSMDPLILPSCEDRARSLRQLIYRLVCALTIGAVLTFVVLIVTARLAATNLERRYADESWFDGIRSRLGRPKASHDEELGHHLTQFRVFLQKHDREYESDDESEFRLEVFRTNLQEIERLNQKADTAQYGVNDLADWTDEEFQSMLMPKDAFTKIREETASFMKHQNESARVRETLLNDDYPDHFDWREKNVVTPVKAQGQCGSCWAFATVATVESAYAIGKGELRSLSEQELLDCNLENHACNGGDTGKAFRFVHENGLSREDAYPYVAHRQNSCSVEGDMTKIDVAYYIDPNEESIMNWLVNFGPVNIGISVPPDMKPYTGGVYKPSDYDCKFRVVGLHALMIVGYGTTDEGEKYWIVKNSWGQKWGIEDGYVYFARGINTCGIEDEPIGLLA
ncbi:cathepsin L-like cysteine proteinase [Aphelenchoides avenae]|nr:cathepsin L-like cysteine proteinase [Aphelenchus avenae]